MVVFNNLFDNSNVTVIETKENVRVIEHICDKSVSYDQAFMEYYAEKMNLKKRQALITLKDSGFVISSGAMQWMAGSLKGRTDVKSVGDFFKKIVKGSVTKESSIKPRYFGTGFLMLEPTYKYLILEDIGEWVDGMVLEDGMFLGCQDTIIQTVTARNTISSIALGNEGLFNLTLKGKGIAILESPVPREELIEVSLENDELRIDGNFAVAWSSSLKFTVERSTKSLAGSAVSGEGLVNVYRGTGKVLMSPVENSRKKIKAKTKKNDKVLPNFSTGDMRGSL